MAEVHLLAGRLDEALRCADVAIKSYQELDNPACEGTALILKSAVFKTQGRFQDSLNAAVRALELGKLGGDDNVQAEAQKAIEAIQGTQLQLPMGMMGTMQMPEMGEAYVETAAADA